MSRRILIISEDLVEPWDEGIKKFASSIGRALAAENAVRVVNVDRSGLAAARNGSRGADSDRAVHSVPGTRTFLRPVLRREIRALQPGLVVYVPSSSSTVSSFARSFVLRRYVPDARLGMVALIPRRHPRAVGPLLRATAPDCVFVPSFSSLLHLSDHGIRGSALPVGVDVAQFRRARPDERPTLRREYGIEEDAFVYLHVGHLRPKRNLGPLEQLARQPGACVIVVGSTSTPEDARVRAGLEAAGVRVIRELVPVEKFYRLADCYVFPTVDMEGCVEIPLSVMEALASGLPVVARPFGGLRDFVTPGDDVRYASANEDLVALASSVRAGARPPVRDMAAFSWSAIANRIVDSLAAGRAVQP